MKFGNCDLNLFIALDVLLEERSVSNAAERLGITQPAMSQMLGKLRAQYNDPIVIRRNNRMELTSLARELAGPVREMLQKAEELVSFNERFDPATSEYQFRIILEDAIQTAIGAALYAAVSRAAPKVSLHILRDGGVEELSKGRADMMLSHHHFPEPILSELIYSTPFASIARINHPHIDGELDLERFVTCDHLVIYHDDMIVDSVEEEIDRQLEVAGLSRNRRLKISSYVAAKKIVESTDLIATIPASSASRYATDARLVVFPPPVSLAPTPVYALWHEQNHLHPAHRWFRSVLIDLMRAEHENILYGPSTATRQVSRSAESD